MMSVPFECRHGLVGMRLPLVLVAILFGCALVYDIWQYSLGEQFDDAEEEQRLGAVQMIPTAATVAAFFFSLAACTFALRKNSPEGQERLRGLLSQVARSDCDFQPLDTDTELQNV